MKRFFFEDEEDDDDGDEEMMGEAGRGFPEMIPEIFAMPHQDDPYRHILDCSIRICEKSMFWRFISLSKKTSMIEKVFHDLRGLMEPEQQEND
jgi:hypothetical protein